MVNSVYATLDLKNLASLDKRAQAILTPMPKTFFGRIIERFTGPGNLEKSIKKLFQTHVGMEGRKVFSKVWDLALADAGITWQSASSVSIETLQKIDAALKRAIVYQGKGIDTSRAPTNNPTVHSMMQCMIGGGDASSSWVTRDAFRAVFLSQDLNLQRDMREELKFALLECCKSLPSPGTPEEKLYEAFVGHVIALIPYCYPPQGEAFLIPVKREGEWTVCEYEIDERIEIPTRDGVTPIPHFGLVSKEADPILTCMGTTYPAADGFVATVLSDFTPGHSVGAAAYLQGREKIGRWMEGKENVKVYGMSLGGAFSFHILRDFKDKLASINAFNPTGLYPEQWTEKYEEGVKVNIYTQDADLASYLGSFPEGKNVEVTHFIRGEEGTSENLLSAHAKVYSGSKFVTMLRLQPESENRSFFRKCFTALHRTFSFVVYYSVIVSSYVFKQLHRFASFLGIRF
ncbi:MAG: hypothetical protein NTX49_03805 [Chlamydiae bacterium]|nr:hypothetical protein [Chlamydiota bacterium]